jgi:hypothetical protein
MSTLGERACLVLYLNVKFYFCLCVCGALLAKFSRYSTMVSFSLTVSNAVIHSFIFNLNIEFGLFALQLKLHPGVMYSHAASKVCPAPELHVIHQPNNKALYLKYAINSGSVDWRYLFDLCGAIYRLSDIQELLTACAPYSNPNTLEIHGNSAFWKHALSFKYSSCACVSRPTVVVITVNRVQDVHEVPVYTHAAGYSLDELNKLLDHKEMIPKLDIHRYRNTTFPCVHIGELWFQHESSSRSSLTRSCKADPEVSCRHYHNAIVKLHVSCR